MEKDDSTTKDGPYKNVPLIMKLCCVLIALCVAVVVAVEVTNKTEDSRGLYYNEDEAGSLVRPISQDRSNSYKMLAEDGPHKATWLQWPHDFGWDDRHVKRYEPMWIAMTKALHVGEKVMIVVFDNFEHKRVQGVLQQAGVEMNRIGFVVAETDDVWVRDNGPIFVLDSKNTETVENWRFNGWGYKADFWNDDYVPQAVGQALSLPVKNIPMVMEGGSFEVDGRGTLMAKRSSILNRNRNPGWTQADAEDYFKYYLGVSNFIWLDGEAGYDVTDDHIDGTARFAKGNVIVTHNRRDFWDRREYDILRAARDKNGNRYRMVHLPLTRYRVRGVNDFGLYINYYVGNEVVLVPKYNDPNDSVAANILGDLYSDKKVVSIDVRELYKDGGIIHCVTQQQPQV